MELVIGKSAIKSAISAYAIGIIVGMGDKYPCVDKTCCMDDVTTGCLYTLNESDYINSLKLIDKYEGVDEGYYKRQIIEVYTKNRNSLLIPSWIYLRGPKL